MSDINQITEALQLQIEELKAELMAIKYGNSQAFAAISMALREIPGYQPVVMERMLTHSLKYAWPTQQIPDTEVNEVAFSAPLRFLLNAHQENRDLFRNEPEA